MKLTEVYESMAQTT